MKKFAYWPSVNADIRKYVKACKTCLKTKVARGTAPMLRNPEVMRPWDRLNLDLIGPLPTSTDGNKYILSVVDTLTRYSVAVPMPDKAATTVTRCLINHVFAPFGLPRSLYSDQGKEFVAQVTTDVIKAFGVKQRQITVYRPQASGLVERFNQHIVSILRSLVHEHPETWDVSLPLAVLAHNISYHRTLRESPYFLFYLRDANVPYETLALKPSPWYNVDNMKQELLLRAHTTFDIARKFLEEDKSRQEEYANKNAKPVTYQVGDRVYVQKKGNVPKLSSKYVGPMRLIRLLGVIAWVKDLVSFKVYQVHVDRLKIESSVSEIEAPHVQDAFPTKEAILEGEYERVKKSELEKAGLKETNVDRTVAERFFAQELTIPSQNNTQTPISGGSNKIADPLGDVATAAQTNEDVQASKDCVNSATEQLTDVPCSSATEQLTDVPYPLRSKGIKVDDNEWVMSKTLEYK